METATGESRRSPKYRLKTSRAKRPNITSLFAATGSSITTASQIIAAILAIGALVGLYFPGLQRKWEIVRQGNNRYVYIGALLGPPDFDKLDITGFAHPAWDGTAETGGGLGHLDELFAVLGDVVYSTKMTIVRREASPDGDVVSVMKDGACFYVERLTLKTYTIKLERIERGDDGTISRRVIRHGETTEISPRCSSAEPRECAKELLAQLQKRHGVGPKECKSLESTTVVKETVCPRIAVWAQGSVVTCAS